MSSTDMSNAGAPSADGRVEFDITGMTCAACAARIERRLNRFDGVEASVNYATERATIELGGAAVSAEELIEAIRATGYGAVPSTPAGAVNRSAGLRLRLIVAVVLGLPVLVLSMVPALQFTGWQWVIAAAATPVATWAAWPFHRAMVLNARHGQATMDTLISVGVSAAYLWSMWALVFTDAGRLGMTMSMSLSATFGEQHVADHHDGAPIPHLYFEVASTVVAFLLAGRYFEARAKQRAGDALRALLDLGAKQVTVLDEDGAQRVVPVEELSAGQCFVVRPGEKIATDGVVVRGRSAIDTSLVTGESVPVEVGPDDAVIGATINSGGLLVVRATHVGAETQLAQMARLVEAAQSGKAPVQRLADRVSAVFVPVVIVLSLVTLAVWLTVTGDIERAFAAAVAVLIIACPCALGLATPTALLVGTGRGAQLGILIKGPEILESTRRVDVVVLDKTGTVTTGAMALVGLHPHSAGGLGDDELLRLTAALEAGSEHPIARAIVDAAAARSLMLSEVTEFHASPGVGVRGVVEGRSLEARRAGDDHLAGDDGQTLVELVEGDAVLGVLAVADTVKASSAQAVARFRELGLEPVLLTGDRAETAAVVAREVGIEEVRAGVRPDEKVAAIIELQRAGRVVAMVGDGVNDAAALMAADLGIAMGTGTDVAIEASDLTLLRSDLLAAVDAVRLSRRTLSTIKANLFWAFAYNTAAIPLAMSGLLSPLIAGAAMAFSSVFVVTNSLRLRRFV